MNQPISLAFPDFIYSEPTLASGGGVEVVTLANPAWFTNNGFSTDFSFTPFQPPASAEQIPLDSEHHQDTLSTPFGFESAPDHPPPAPPPFPAPTPDLTILRRNVPPPLPVYSASGFDLLSILARVATRPNPKVVLGSVDLKCSFVVVDTRRFDHAIVYCSPSFCTLTGYAEDEIIGKNCRFLQAPAGRVSKGESRNHTSHDAVVHLRKSLVANKECQTTILNFRKDGSPFMNLLTVIPLSGGVSGSPDEENEYIYHVGFQVDLAQQPGAILEKLHHGSYFVNYSATLTHAQYPNQLSAMSNRDRKPNNPPAVVMSKELRKLIADPLFVKSIPLSASTTIPPSLSASSLNQDDPVTGGTNHLLHLLLLEAAPDFIHVVSLKGDFLYVAPSVRRVLGYEPEDMVGKAISNFAHPKDVDPLMRELKESSATGVSAEGASQVENRSSSVASPRTVNLLFRARTKIGMYVWVECRGRLHVEPGKGKKAIVLSGRAREMSDLTWDEVKFAGGLARGDQDTSDVQEKMQAGLVENRRQVEQEVWGLISGHKKETMTFLSVGKGVEDVLGWSADELIGRNVMDIVLDEGARSLLGGVVTNTKVYRQHTPVHRQLSGDVSTTVRRVHCMLRKKGSGVADVWFIIYSARQHQPLDTEVDTSDVKGVIGSSISPVPLVYQIRLVKAQTILPELTSGVDTTMPLVPPQPQLSHEKSPELSSSSSLAGAVPILHLSTPPTTATPTTTTTTLDMFEELAISKGSSWQYELQQLRFVNIRLREELAALELTLCGGESKESGDISLPDDSQDCALDNSTVAHRFSLTSGFSSDEVSTARDTTQGRYPSTSSASTTLNLVTAAQTQTQPQDQHSYHDSLSSVSFNRQYFTPPSNQLMMTQATQSLPVTGIRRNYGTLLQPQPSMSMPSSMVVQTHLSSSSPNDRMRHPMSVRQHNSTLKRLWNVTND